MKKALINGFLGIALVFAMAACNGNNKTDETAADTTCAQTEQCKQQCMKHCQMTCPDSTCLAANCENCACPEDSPCHKKAECKGEGQCCKEKAATEGQCCKEQGEGCKKECENHK
ncbi:MAG: hypothetical protein J6031_04555 [Bacteroidales bacterium]|nr:hypothetical protein [Bacteroidales bacterium]